MVERFIHSADRLEVMEALQAMPQRVEAELAGVPESVLRFRPSESDWSVKEVVGHLRDGAEVWAKRLHQVYAQNDPQFMPYDQEARVKERGYQDADLGAVLEEMKAQRLAMIGTLSHAVDWTRLGQWPGVGRRSLKQLAEALIEAEDGHLEQIRTLKEAARTAPARS